MVVSLEEMQEDIFRRFTDKTNGGDFGIIQIEFPLNTEMLKVSLVHYKAQNVVYKFSFSSVQSYMLIQENLPDEAREGLTYSATFKSVVLKELLGSKYMEYLHMWTDLPIFFDDASLKNVKHYCVYAQNVIVNIVTDQIPVIEIFED
ncbi:hypothetical protein [Pedobacter rhizosphaerae]|uniref:Uncharacterized protein n=1 Tax=Pedobacter rhizosphaerae TaxID=390241 RepID=A0A1H9PK57_9SPHI|nr:hypothetical protein [Pedobacter rhizosphaerae]SER48666.1 hypothetical protein SAMN04488023_1104 [Pedobacter rhizosphaerae]